MGQTDESRRWAQRYITVLALLAGTATVAAGVWCLAAPRSFAELVNFTYHEHFLHDLGAFQIGIGATVLLALIWPDALATALTGFLIGNTIHSAGHALDVGLGGHVWDAPLLVAVSVLVMMALALRLRQLGYVVGAVHPASTPALAPFVRQKTILLTTYRRDGTPRGVPVSIAVDGDHAVIRSFEKAAKTRRLQRNPMVEIEPSTAMGRPTGPAVTARMWRLEGEDARRAAALLARKHPFLHGVLVPLTHRAGHSRFGRTVHFGLDPVVGTAAGTCVDAAGVHATKCGEPLLTES